MRVLLIVLLLAGCAGMSGEAYEPNAPVSSEQLQADKRAQLGNPSSKPPTEFGLFLQEVKGVGR